MNITDLQQTIQATPGILIYFQNDQCAPCTSLRPKVQAMMDTDFPEMKLLFIDSFENIELTAHFNIFTHPTLLVFFEGKEYLRNSKYVSVQDLKNKIERLYNLIFS